jgi:glycosyltransferase involved in cell wall biosynthesis
VRRGHEVDVIHDTDAHALLHRGPEPEPVQEPQGLRTIPLRSRFGALSCLATQQLGRALVHGPEIRRILEEGGYDVIHHHNVSLVGGPTVLAWGNAVKLYMAHEHWLVCPTHVLWRHDREVCTGRECVRCTLIHRRPPQLWRYTGLLERMAEHVDVFYAPSAFSAQKHAEYGFPRKLEALPYFIADPEPGEEEAGDQAQAPWDRPYFLFVGRLAKIKGLQDVLPHFGEDAPADLLVIGTGDYEPELRRQASPLPRVHFLGPRPAEEIRPLYRHALATIFPSLCYETFGIVLIEAFREGTPVIARNLGPLPEIVRQSGGGMLFDTDAQLRGAIHRLARERELREKMGGNGKRAFLERWTESVVMRDYFEMIRGVAERRGLTRVLEQLGGARAPTEPGKDGNR